jgi:hypothetical protein
LRQQAAENTSPTLAYFETSSGDLGYLGASDSALVVGALSGKGQVFRVNGSTTAMSIGSNTNVGVGIGPQSAGRLAVQSPGTTDTSFGLQVFNGNGSPTLSARDDGRVLIGHLGSGASAKHVCIGGPTGGYLEHCMSAAEYVPTIDGGSGYPETGDLVSIAPAVANPYGDSHGPFVVQKAAQSCDTHLLGYIVDPERGADGPKLNGHYLPLAIFGYFPAKVTTENGPIRRGDPLTSSSKAGYAMKATGACKIIGYALEDSKDGGMIQVFAHLSETAAPKVAALQTQIEALKAQNAALEARLAALEAAVATDTASRPPLRASLP